MLRRRSSVTKLISKKGQVKLVQDDAERMLSKHGGGDTGTIVDGISWIVVGTAPSFDQSGEGFWEGNRYGDNGPCDGSGAYVVGVQVFIGVKVEDGLITPQSSSVGLSFLACQSEPNGGELFDASGGDVIKLLKHQYYRRAV